MRFIYCYTNLITGKKYVGQTNNPDRRKREHLSCSRNKKSVSYNDLFHYKLRQYGIDNFKFEILETIESEDQNLIDEREQYWIKEKDSLVGKNGYNMTNGGQQGYYNYNYNRKLTDEQIDDIIEMLKNEVPYYVIQDKYNISGGTVSNINHGWVYKRKGIKYPIALYNSLSKDILERLVKLLEEGELTFKQIAEELGICEASVKKINYGKMRKGLYPDYPIRKIFPKDAKARKIKKLLLESDYNIKEIEEMTGASSQIIRNINLGKTYHDDELNYPLRKTL